MRNRQIADIGQPPDIIAPFGVFIAPLGHNRENDRDPWVPLDFVIYFKGTLELW